jgi:membrane protein DedA with SNARE-associated domain
MIDALLAAVPTHGVWLVAAVTFLSCLALPMPASLVMLTAGGFAAAGDLDLWQVLGAALLVVSLVLLVRWVVGSGIAA